MLPEDERLVQKTKNIHHWNLQTIRITFNLYIFFILLFEEPNVSH